MNIANDEKITQYYALSPQKFSVLEKLIIEQNFSQKNPASAPELDLEIQLRTNEESPSRRLTLKFHGIRDLHLQQPSWSVFILTLIEITSIEDRQWESIKYSVNETEDETLSFLCQDFEMHVT